MCPNSVWEGWRKAEVLLDYLTMPTYLIGLTPNTLQAYIQKVRLTVCDMLFNINNILPTNMTVKLQTALQTGQHEVSLGKSPLLYSRPSLSSVSL